MCIYIYIYIERERKRERPTAPRTCSARAPAPSTTSPGRRASSTCQTFNGFPSGIIRENCNNT